MYSIVRCSYQLGSFSGHIFIHGSWSSELGLYMCSAGRAAANLLVRGVREWHYSYAPPFLFEIAEIAELFLLRAREVSLEPFVRWLPVPLEPPG